MRCLLDTNAWLWWLNDHSRLNDNARAVITNPDNQIYVSAVNVWEVSVKEAKGFLDLGEDFDQELASQSFLPLSITYHHARKAAYLPPLHKDPFDRLLVAQSMIESLTLITSDRLLQRYGISVIEAA